MIFLPLICPDVARISATRHLVRILNVLHYMTTLYFWPCIKGAVVRKRNAKRELLLNSKYKNQGRHQKENIFSVDATFYCIVKILYKYGTGKQYGIPGE